MLFLASPSHVPAQWPSPPPAHYRNLYLSNSGKRHMRTKLRMSCAFLMNLCVCTVEEQPLPTLEEQPLSHDAAKEPTCDSATDASSSIQQDRGGVVSDSFPFTQHPFGVSHDSVSSRASLRKACFSAASDVNAFASERFSEAHDEVAECLDECPPEMHVRVRDASSWRGAEFSATKSIAQSMPQSAKEESKIVKMAWDKLVRWSRSWQLLQARSHHNQMKKIEKVVVLGGGSFGTALAVLLARKTPEMKVLLVLRDVVACATINQSHINKKYFPHHTLPKNVMATLDAKEALVGAQFCIHAIPVQASAAFLRRISEHVPPTLPFLSVSKGLELSTLEMMSQVIPKALGNPRQPIVVLSGPSFSIELMDQLPTAVVVASKDKELARATQQLLASRYLRVNTSSDVIGVEMAGALKNVLAIAAGIVEGMNLGNNCMAALVAQGCSEIRWLAEKMGAKPSTLAGLSGTGDIMLTCFVKLSRNRSVGVRLGSGETLESIQSSMNQVAEGVATAGAVIALARKYRVQMPVLTAVARILDNELTPKKAVLELMSLPQVEEV